MPYVSDEFVQKAVTLAKHAAEAKEVVPVVDTKATAEKKAAEDRIMAKAELVADTLVTYGVVEAHNKEAVTQKLANHEEALSALNKTAQLISAPALGTPAVSKAAKEADSNEVFLRRMGF